MIRQEGAALVETAIALAVFLAVLFGLISFGYALYTYNFVSDAARVATRYAVVRDVNSCTIEPTFPNCNLYTSAPLQTYVQNLGYPGMSPSNLTLTATWLTETTVSGVTAWTPCLLGPCNVPGNAVQVVVYYTLPLNIPFWQNGSLTVSSTSQMVIN
ncbi:MAG: pilus assembly protein [Acidobacteriota bacterium]|nr:pilus assembly protein [Acidobacteriota bacterium]